MKLVTFSADGRTPRLGVLRGPAVYPLPGRQDVLDAPGLSPGELDSAAERTPLALADVQLLAPIVRPRRNGFCVGRNYHEHRAEADAARGKRAADDTPGSCSTR